MFIYGMVSMSGTTDSSPMNVTAPPQTQPSLLSSTRRISHQVPEIEFSNFPTTTALWSKRKKPKCAWSSLGLTRTYAL